VVAQRGAYHLCDLRFQADFRTARHVLGRDLEAAALRCNDRCVTQQLGDGLHIQGGRHHHDTQILAQVLLALDAQGQSQIGVQTALVEFVEDHAADAGEPRVFLQHAREDAFSDHFDARLAAHASLEPRAKSDTAADGLSQKLRHAAGDGARRNAPRFEHQDLLPLEPGTIPQEERHDGALTGARRSLQQHGAAPG
jgi:hypothetical protein